LFAFGSNEGLFNRWARGRFKGTRQIQRRTDPIAAKPVPQARHSGSLSYSCPI